ncbi:MAG: hypothetical protein PHZ02_17085 [Desulfocapsaceae bacterium]|nr:hypothetical protein [Desulfocapsaceae bacterium]
MPEQLRGRPTIDPERIRSAKPPVQVQPQVVPAPMPARVKPVPTGTEKTAPMFRGQQPMPQQRNMPEQLRGRPTIDPERIRSAKPPVQVQPQVVPRPASPVPAQAQPAQPDAEALKRFQEEQAAKKNAAKQDEAAHLREMLKQRGIRSSAPPGR